MERNECKDSEDVEEPRLEIGKKKRYIKRIKRRVVEDFLQENIHNTIVYSMLLITKDTQC